MEVKNRKKKVTKPELQELIKNKKDTEVDSKSGFTKPANPDYPKNQAYPRNGREAPQGKHGAFKKGEEEMKWKVQIAGDEKYLEDLVSVLEALNFDNPRIYKDSGKFFLEGSIFESSDDEREVSEKAKTFLTLASVVPHFKTQRAIEMPRIAGIIETLSEANKKNIYDSEGNLTIQEITQDNGSVQRNVIIRVNSVEIKLSVPKVTVTTSGDEIPNFQSLDEIKSYINQIANDSVKMNEVKKSVSSGVDSLETLVNKLRSDPEMVEVQELKKIIDDAISIRSKVSGQPEVRTGLEVSEWASLYRIYEIIAYDVGGAKSDNKNKEILKAKNWVKPELIDDFTETSNYYHRHSAKRIFNLKPPPERKIPLSKAEEVISTLVSKYIEYKVNEQLGRS